MLLEENNTPGERKNRWKRYLGQTQAALLVVECSEGLTGGVSFFYLKHDLNVSTQEKTEGGRLFGWHS